MHPGVRLVKMAPIIDDIEEEYVTRVGVERVDVVTIQVLENVLMFLAFQSLPSIKTGKKYGEIRD